MEKSIKTVNGSAAITVYPDGVSYATNRDGKSGAYQDGFNTGRSPATGQEGVQVHFGKNDRCEIANNPAVRQAVEGLVLSFVSGGRTLSAEEKLQLDTQTSSLMRICRIERAR